MRSKTTSKAQGKTIAVLILDTYQEYCNLGYPADPKIYVIKAHKDTLNKVVDSLNKGIITKGKLQKNWGFQTEVDHRLLPGEVVFGPEQVRIITEW